MNRLRPALTGLTGLTTRGRSFTAAGGAAGFCALLLGQRDLMRMAVLLVVLPIGCALVLGRVRYQLSLTRTISPARVAAGTAAQVRLEIENPTGHSTRVLLAEDQLPDQLGTAPRFVLARLPSGRRATVTYSVRPSVRGRFLIGPLHLKVTDPFGLCEVTRSLTAADPLVVVPRIWPLPPVGTGGRWTGTGESGAHNVAASGENDVATREYRHGDDLRRVHWRSTARRGELMVRRDEQPRQRRATVLLDTREDGHRGEGPTSSFEWAISAAASVAMSLTDQRYGVRLLLDERPTPWTTPHHPDTSNDLLDRFALVDTGPRQRLAGAVSTLATADGDGLVVAVLGEIDREIVTTLARLGPQSARLGPQSGGVALLLRTTDWGPLPAHRTAELDAERTHAAAVLASAGWSVTECGPGEDPAAAWSRVTGGPPGLLTTGGPPGGSGSAR